jgi:hypothetical protein
VWFIVRESDIGLLFSISLEYSKIPQPDPAGTGPPEILLTDIPLTGVGCGDLKGGWNFRIFPVRTEKVSMEFRRGGILPHLDEFCFTTSRKNLFYNCRCIVPNFIND